MVALVLVQLVSVGVDHAIAIVGKGTCGSC